MASAREPSEAQFPLGGYLGPYRVIEELGRGGMGVVYKALQASLDRYVAIKTLPAQFMGVADFRERFHQEAATAARLDHPHILPVFDYGEDAGSLYIVMPLVNGGTFHGWLRHVVELDRAIDVVTRILGALQYAHGQGVVHRDIKPGNILMSQGDWPLLTDFGIAKIISATLMQTSSGTVVGTPEYMAPEQSQGAHLDHRADIYAMGVMLYEILAGQRPFRGENALAVALQHISAPIPSPCRANPGLSSAWDEVIHRSLAKDPNDRYPNALAMRDAIQAAWQQEQGGNTRAPACEQPSAAEMLAAAERALAEADWAGAVALCGRALEVEPANLDAVRLLMRAQEGLNRPLAEPRAPAPVVSLPHGAPSGGPPASAARSGPSPSYGSRVLTTALFTDIVDSTPRAVALGDRRWRELLEAHHALVRRQLQRCGGREIDTAGDGFFATFDAPARAIECACAIVDAVRSLELEIRAGVHTGEAEVMGNRLVGVAVHTAARVAAQAGPGEVVVSSTVRQLVAGGEIAFEDRGEHELKGLPGTWRLFAVSRCVPPPSVPSEPPADAAPAAPVSGLAAAPAAAPSPSATRTPNNLPQQLTSFVGREREVAEVRDALASRRLVTLVGLGGLGKTRLALQVADAQLGQFPDGAWLVELASVSDAELVPQAVATALGVREQPGQSMLAVLTQALQARSMLLVLDNCEHLVGACVQLVAGLLRACSHLRILATSREALGVAGEVIWRVPPLALPQDAVQGYAAPSSVAEYVDQYAATRLFVERARAAQSTFVVTPNNAPALIQVCTRLDGIPLAIELAAARVKVLSVEQLAGRLNDRFRLLTGGSRSGLARQQTLRATIDWSYDLLSEPEKLLLRRLSVFPGHFSLEVAETVCADESIDELSVLDLLTQLVDKSLVMADEDTGQARYRLLETIREYAAEKLLAAGETAALRSRHRDAYLLLAEQAEQGLQGPDLSAWVDRLEQEYENLRAALEWCKADPDGAESGLGLAGALWRFWWMRGIVSEGRGWLQAMLEQGDSASPVTRIKALNGAGNLAYAQGDCDRAIELHEACLALRRETGDKRGTAMSLNNLAAVAQAQSDYERATRLHQESLALRRELDDRPGIAASLNNLAAIAHTQGDYERAVALYEESLALKRDLGDERGLAYTLNNLGIISQDQGDASRAVALLDDSLERFRALRDTPNIAATLDHLGEVARVTGDVERAGKLHEEALTLREELGDRRGMAMSISNLANVARDRGACSLAAGLYVRSLHLCQDVNDRQGIAVCLEGLAKVASMEGHAERGARLFGAADALREAFGISLSPVDRRDYDAQVVAACGQIGDAAFAVAWAAGWSMPLDQAVEFATLLPVPT